MSELNDENIKLSKKINQHIRSCDKCLKTVRAFQMIYDEFYRLQRNSDFEKYLRSLVTAKKSGSQTDKFQNLLEDFENFR